MKNRRAFLSMLLGAAPIAASRAAEAAEPTGISVGVFAGGATGIMTPVPVEAFMTRAEIRKLTRALEAGA